MRITVERAGLLRAMTHLHRVVERRPTQPILSNVLIRGDGAGLELKATDNDIEAVERIAANIEQTGGTTVPAHMLYEIVRKLPDGAELSLEEDPGNGTLMLKSGRTRFLLQVLPEDGFPDIAADEFSHRFVLPAAALKRLIDRTFFAVSSDDTRYYLNGIFLHAVAGDGGLRLRAVATDGHRLARTEVEVPSGAEDMPGIIVPRKATAELQKLLEEMESDVEVELSDVKIRVLLDSILLTSKLIDGTYPDYDRVIPKGNDRIMIVDRDEFAAAVDRVSTISIEGGRAVKLSIAEGRLVLSVTNPESGSATEEIIVDYDAEPLDIGFNARYLLDIAGQIQTENAVFRFSDPGSPTLVQDQGETDSLFVLMPMRV